MSNTPTEQQALIESIQNKFGYTYEEVGTLVKASKGMVTRWVRGEGIRPRKLIALREVAAGIRRLEGKKSENPELPMPQLNTLTDLIAKAVTASRNDQLTAQIRDLQESIGELRGVLLTRLNYAETKLNESTSRATQLEERIKKLEEEAEKKHPAKT